MLYNYSNFWGYATIIGDLYQNSLKRQLCMLCSKKIEFKFTDECKQAFDQLKTALTNYPVLRQADPAKPFLLFTDASG